MSSLKPGDRDLHTPDGGHKSTPASTNGKVLEAHERKLREHLATHEMVERMLDPELPG